MPPVVKFLLGQEEMTHTENRPLTNKYQETLTYYNSEMLAFPMLHVMCQTLCSVQWSFQVKGQWNKTFFLLPSEIVSRTD